MNLSGKKILVTGAEGFIGSHLVEYLLTRGHDVKAFVHYNVFGSWGWLDQFKSDMKQSLEVFFGDIRDPHRVKQAVHGCNIIMHLAALIGIPYSYYAPASYIDTNVTGTLNILQAALEYDVEKLIHTSTSEVYGTAKFVPMTEQHALQAQSPYAASKIAADQLALSFYHTFALPVSVIRPFNTFGPRQSMRAVIPTIITQIASGKQSIKLGSRHPTRDFTYVLDTVKGFVAVAEAENSIGEVINIGSHFEVAIGEVAALIATLMQREISIEDDHERLRPQTSEVERLWADNTKARQLTSWQPTYQGLIGFETALKQTIPWFTNYVMQHSDKIPCYAI